MASNQLDGGVGTWEGIGVALKSEISVILDPDMESTEFALKPNISPVTTLNEKIPD